MQQSTVRSTTQAKARSTQQSATRDRLTLIVLPAILATAVALVLVALSPGLAASAVIVAILLGAAAAVRDRSVPPASIILVGRTPMAAVLAASIEGEGPVNAPILRTEHLAAATVLARTTACSEIVLVDTAPASIPAIFDNRGHRLPIISGAEKLERLLTRIPLEFAVTDRWLTRLGPERPLDRGYALAKRVIDLTVAFGLALVMLPLLPIVYLAIRLDSPGPILYSQTRVGLGGRTFRIYKFRTMRTDAEANGAVWATKRDPRITRTGRFMRKTRLDELPQLWNLLNGDMALVGPRPERPEFTTKLAEEIPAYDFRHTVKPGLTGWAQVCYRYTSSIRDTRNKVEYDLYYVKNCTLKLDLIIMLKTVKVVLAMKGQ